MLFGKYGLTTMNQSMRRTRILILLFIAALSISGITAIPLTWETTLLVRITTSNWLPIGSIFPELVTWISRVNTGLVDTYQKYPFLAYGTDWLAFGHIAIAVAFLGAFKDPMKNVWVIDFGMIVCILVIPWALIFGAVHSVPFFWRLIDCSFGVVGIVPLWICRNMIRHMSTLNKVGISA
jgi:hypothetical protein